MHEKKTGHCVNVQRIGFSEREEKGRYTVNNFRGEPRVVARLTNLLRRSRHDDVPLSL